MSNKTVQYKRTLRGSVGAGVGALFNGNGRRFFILEHKDASKYHKAGESQKIIIDQIELGRDNACQVRFDDDTFPTVSRKHAAIVKDGDRWKLIQLSQVNSTFLNGKPVTTEWYLENGDEIQLSVGGPRMGFIVPAGKQSLVSSIKMTERLELFRKQALRPYKTAICVLCTLLVVLSAVGGYQLYDLHQLNVKLEKDQKAIKADNDTLRIKVTESTKQLVENKNLIGDLTKQIGILKKQIRGGNVPIPVPVPDKLTEDVFFIKLAGYSITSPNGDTGVLEIGDKFEGEKVKSITGSGFLLNDGTFVTARHVVEPWYFGDSNIELFLNLMASNGGKVVAHFIAVSPKGTRFEFTTSQFNCNRSHDTMESKNDVKYRVVSTDNSDFAYCKVGIRGNLAYDRTLSNNLKAGDKLVVWGYPLGLGGDLNKATPSKSTAEVARDGLAEGGYILTTASGFEHGNSGGPVFVERDGKSIVIGIVSAGAGRSTGFVVPISVIK